MATLTIFTPTYNRAHTLLRTYESLCNQSCDDFEWLIVDDGSSDETKTLVEKWRCQNKMTLHYIYKENGGLHTGYNIAIDFVQTELCMCVDSDDWLPNDAVEKILLFWKKHKSNEVAGILGLDFTKEGQPIGGYLPPNVKQMKFIELGYKYHHRGDVKMVHRTKLLKSVSPMPTYEGEKFFNPIYLFHKVDVNYPLLVLNENLCFVEYQQDGMTEHIFKQYVNSPKSFSELRKLVMSRPDAPFLLKFRNAIHYVSSQLMIKNKEWLRESPKKLMTICAVPLGCVLYLYIKMKNR